MLRHIRMTSRAEPYRIPSKLFVAMRDGLRTLYPLAVPHRTPTLGEPDPICRCRYPLYTLCTPEPSPYDLAVEGGSAVAMVSPSVVADATAAAAAEANEARAEGYRTSDRDCSSINSTAALGEEAAATNVARVSDADTADGPQPRRRGSEGHNNRIRPALRVQKLWRGRERPVVYRPNVLPNRPTCYRCDICDGFQHVAEEEAERDDDDAGEANNSSTARHASSSTEDLAKTERMEEEEGDHDIDEEEEEANEEDEFAGRPVSTDITNTIMPDTEVAELRYSDPFLVEVLGRPNVPVISRKFSKQVMAQFARCNFTAREFARRLRYVSANAADYSAVYEQWIQQQLQIKRQAARERRVNGCGNSLSNGDEEKAGRSMDGSGRPCSTSHSAGNARADYLTAKVELLDRASYAVRFALAAYGLPYELGYLNSVADVVKMQAEPHRRYTCASSEEQMESMRRMLQGEEPNELMEFASSRYSIAVGKPCYAIVLDHEARRVVLSFRGTLTMADAVVDVTEGYAEVDLLKDGSKGVEGVEAGSAKAAVPLSKLSTSKQRRYGDRSAAGAREGDGAEKAAATLRTRIPLGFYDAVREAATSLLPALHTIHSQYEDYELFVTGHSLGAMEANIFHLLYCFPGDTAPVPFRKVHTYGFGGAPVVEEAVAAELNARLSEEEAATGSRLVNFSYGMDCISRLHVRGILQVLTEKKAARESANDSSAVPGKRSRRSLSSPLSASPSSSGMLEAGPDFSTLPQLTLPGSCYNIPHTLRRGFFPVPMDCPWRSQLILSVESVYHHFPIHYARSLNRLLSYYQKRLTETSSCPSSLHRAAMQRQP